MSSRRADAIAAELEQLIVTGAFKDGERLNEIKLAERFGVSRTPVREAFQKLGTSGLVEQIPRRGVFARHPGPVELLDMFEAMAELESACGRLAAGRITDQALKDLNLANQVCMAAVDEGDADGYYRENERFHHIIYDQSRNQYLSEEAKRLSKRLKPFRRMQLHLRGRMQQSMQEHRDIVAALEAQDGDTAARVLRDHVAVQGEKFHHLLAGLKTVAE